MRRVNKVGLVVGGLALAGGGLTFASAAVPDSNQNVHGCDDGSGVIYIIDTAQGSCSSLVGAGSTSVTIPTNPQPLIMRQHDSINAPANAKTWISGGDTCPTGYTAISTGWKAVGADVTFEASYNVIDEGFGALGGRLNTWNVSGFVTNDNASIAGHVTIYALCMNNVYSDEQALP